MTLNPTPAMQAIAAGGGWPPPPPPPPPGPPILYALMPSSGPTSGGNTVLIYGQGLYGVTSVTFGGVAATIVYQPPAPPPYPGPYPGPWPGPGPWDGGGDDWDHGDHRHLMQVAAGGGDWGGGGYPGPLVVLAPAHAAGTVPVVVTTANGTSNPLNYTYVAPPTPTITSIAPTTGPTSGGTPFVITGTNLAGATSVTFGANAATILGGDATHIFGLTPAAMAAGPVTVTVTTPNGSVPLPSGFTYFTTPLAPAIGTSTPTTGSPAGGTVITMTGTNLGSILGILFNGVPGTITTNNGTTLTVTTPAGAAGVATVTLVTAGGTLPGPSFTYV